MLVPTTAFAARPQVVLQQGQVIDGLPANEVFVEAVDNQGGWRAKIWTSPTWRYDEAVVGPQGVVAETGVPAPRPAPGEITVLNDAELSANGNEIVFARASNSASSTDRWMLLQDGRAVGWSDRQRRHDPVLSTVRINDAGQILMAVSRSNYRYFVRADPQPDGSYVRTELPGSGYIPGVASISTYSRFRRLIDFNASASIAWCAYLANGGEALLIDERVIAVGSHPAISGSASFYGLCDTGALDLNDAGSVLYRATVNRGSGGIQDVIALDRTTLYQEADVLPGMPPFSVIAAFGQARVGLGNNGNTAFTARWTVYSADEDAGLFVNGHVVLKEGDTLDGYGVVSLVDEDLDLSDNGRWLFATLRVNGGPRLAVLLDLADEVALDAHPGAIPSTVPTAYTFQHAVPGHRILLVTARHTGSTPLSLRCGDVDLGLDGSAVAGFTVADDRGRGTFTLTAPAAATRYAAHLQPVDIDACAVGDVLRVEIE